MLMVLRWGAEKEEGANDEVLVDEYVVVVVDIVKKRER